MFDIFLSGGVKCLVLTFFQRSLNKKLGETAHERQKFLQFVNKSALTQESVPIPQFGDFCR